MSKYGMSKADKIALMLVAAHLSDTFADTELERLADAVHGINATIAELAEALENAITAGDYLRSLANRDGGEFEDNYFDDERAALEKARVKA